MAKAASPIRLQQDLMQAAETTARRFHRSTAEQIEYWAQLGRSVSSKLNPDVLLSIAAGLARLNVEPVIAQPVEPDEVFGALELQRKNGALQRSVTTSKITYQASLTHPGLLECFNEKGEVTTGRFESGEFVAMGENDA